MAEATAGLVSARKATRGPVSQWYTSCDPLPPTRPPVFHHASPFSYIALSVTLMKAALGSKPLGDIVSPNHRASLKPFSVRQCWVVSECSSELSRWVGWTFPGSCRHTVVLSLPNVAAL